MKENKKFGSLYDYNHREGYSQVKERLVQILVKNEGEELMSDTRKTSLHAYCQTIIHLVRLWNVRWLGVDNPPLSPLSDYVLARVMSTSIELNDKAMF